MKRSFWVVVFGLFLLSCFPVSAGSRLAIEVSPERVEVTLGGVESGNDWVVQYSRDAEDWENIAFFPSGSLDLSVDWWELSEGRTSTGFFRAVQLAGDQSFLRRFLDERRKWRLSGVLDYDYELRQNFGIVSWQGNVAVVDGAVDSYETIDRFPPVVGDPEVPTIEGLFQRLARAIEQNASTINVTWNKEFGYPESAFIDLDPNLADEESSWTVNSWSLPGLEEDE